MMTHSNEHILIIDTRDDWLSLAEDALSRAGYQVTTARSIQEAKRILDANGDHFDLILADQKVADADIGVLHDVIWAEPDRRRRVVVVFPSEPKLIKMRTHFRLGAFDCVDKQYERDKLVALVQEIFGHPFSPQPRQSRPLAAASPC